MTDLLSTSICNPLRAPHTIPLVNINALKPGDFVWRALDGVLFLTHFGCLAGFDYLGRAWIFEHTKEGSRLVLLEQFSKGYQVYFKTISDAERAAAILRMRELLANPRAYDELQFNCESAKNYITTGTAYSAQAIAALAFVGISIYAMVKRSA